MTTLDIDYIRAQFPALSHQETGRWAFFENAGGSYAATPVIEKLNHFMTTTKMQPYGHISPAREAGEAMDRSHRLMAESINADIDEVMFGPSTSINSYVLSKAFAEVLKSGDEIVVTNQDHEANIGVWRRLSENNSGVVLREWCVNSDTGLLDENDLKTLVNERTRFVFVTHCSNIVGKINGIASISDIAHSAGAKIVVDGVSFAPHLAVDVKALKVDIYLYSLYKVFGPHQGLMYVQRDLLHELPNQGHYFNAEDPSKGLTPAGPMHGEIACVSGIVDYLTNVYRHHFGATSTASIQSQVSTMMSLGHVHEIEQSNRILDFLRDKDARIIGNTHAIENERAPTIAFSPRKIAPEAAVKALSEQQIGVGAGHFYAYRLMEALGIEPDVGVVRVSLVHYTSAEDVDRLLNALDEVI